MTIRVTNATLESTAHNDYATVEDAYRAAVLAGVRIAADEVAGGRDNATVQVAVDLVGQRNAAWGAVTVSTARLLTPEPHHA